MTEFALPPNDEPFDFRRQAATYARWRRDYSRTLYETVEARTGPAQGRTALDVGCGTGFVTHSLEQRGWRAVGVDFSAPMLAQARAAADGTLRLVRARGEALPVTDGGAALLTCGTAFHWLAPRPALEEFRRVLAPGGWVALFWRYACDDEPSSALVDEVLRSLDRPAPDGLRVHPPEPFRDSGLVAAPPLVLDTVVEWSAQEFHGYVSTVEYFRRLTGDRHAAFLDRLREAVFQRHPDGFRERNQEHLFLAQRPPTDAA